MRVLVAPDSFKSTLSAAEAAEVIAGAARAALPGVEVEACPLADGGEGTLRVWARAVGAEVFEVPACDLFGVPLRCPAARDPATGDVLLEAAHTCGLPPAGLRDPVRALSTGLGLAMRAVLDRDPGSRIRVALGGTGTVDGGLGAARALGLLSGAASASAIGGILALPPEPSFTLPGPFLRPPVFLCDTRAPLLGSSGAAAVFGPQKGIPADRIADFDAALGRLVVAAAVAVGRPFVDTPGFGAAGGIAALFSLVAGASCESGAEYIFNALQFAQRVREAGLVVTGEGCLDETSLTGKLVGAVADLCRDAGRPLLVVAGRSRLVSARLPAGVVVRAASEPSAPDPDRTMASAILYNAALTAFRDFSKKQLFGPGVLR